MATFTEATIQQGTYEVRKWTADFTSDLPTGGTVTAGTAYHTPPYGSATTPTVAFTDNSVIAQLSSLTALGTHYLDIVATYSNGEKSQVRIGFPVGYSSTAARETMIELITELRGMTEAGINEYAIAGVNYWNDAQLQKVLDKHRDDFIYEALEPEPVVGAGGTSLYYTYELDGRENIEQTIGGTARFYLQDGTGTNVGTANYSVDYLRGYVTFNQDQRGTTYFATGFNYDLNAAAADVWKRKASHHHSAFSFSTDNHSIQREQVYKHCIEMAEMYESMGQDSVTTLQITRSDTDAD